MTQPLFRYIALGDSTGVGVGASDGGYPERIFQRLKAARVPVGILNLAISGSTASEVVTRQLPRVAGKQPALVTLGIGANDLWRMVPLPTFQNQLEQIAEALRESNSDVVWSNIVDLSLSPVAAMVQPMLGISLSLVRDRLSAMNACLAHVLRGPKFHPVDLFATSHAELAQHPEYFCEDGFHPSAKGYDRWAELMWPRIDAIARGWMTAATAA